MRKRWIEPTMSGSLIFRNNLVNIFDEMVSAGIIYVRAPAGYGKTTATRQWLDTLSCKKASISLDEYDNSISHFCERFCKALCDCQSENGALSEIVSHPSFGASPDEFSLRAVAVLTNSERTVLVFDDLHCIQEMKVLKLLLILLRRIHENFQIVLISRNDLPSGFSDLWIRGGLAHITAEHLRFNSVEIEQLYRKRGIAVMPEQAESVFNMTGGWAIGINALLLSGGSASDGIFDYLESFIRLNVWEKWDEDTREFMINTSVAHELYPSLCDKLTGFSGSKERLRRLMRSGAFVLQTKDGAYHYHQLFRDFLRNILAERGEEYVNALLEKEGYWRLSRRDFFDAAECFIRCGNAEGLGVAVDMLEVINRENFLIERLLPILDTPLFSEAAEKRPYLLAFMMWGTFAMGRAEEAEAYADRFYMRFNDILEFEPKRANIIFPLYFVDYRKSLRDMQMAAATLPVMTEENHLPGSISMNMPLLHRCARDFSEISCENADLVVSKLKELIGWVFGDEAGLLAECLKAGIFYERGNLEKAYTHALEANAEIKEHFLPEVKFCAMCILISVLDALGQPKEGSDCLERVLQMIERNRAYYLYPNFSAFAVRRKLGNGDVREAQDWLKELEDEQFHNGLSFYRIYTTFTTCRAYITNGEFDLAIILLRKVLELSKKYKRPLDMIESSILISVAYWKKKRGFQAKAMEYLESAVSMAYEFEYVQLFINDGPEVSGMLHRLLKMVEQRDSKDEIPLSFVKMLYLKTLEYDGGGLTSGQNESIIKFTDKQKAVMKLLCGGKSYREIAESMGIKLPTLRSHIALIYKKLGVTNEKDAVVKIRSLGLLEYV